jgi:two-component system, chemotaxis family, response regulator Rcp1
VLLVEDNPEDVVCVRRALRDLPGNIEVSVVPDGRRALAFLHRWRPYAHVSPPDLMFLDLHLPRKSGEEVLAALKRDPRFTRLPVVVLTVSFWEGGSPHL